MYIAIATRLSFAGMVFGSFVSIMVIYLYSKILYGINVESGETSESKTESKSEISETKNRRISTELSFAQIQLIRNMTKNTLLGFVGLLTTFVIYIETFIDFSMGSRVDSTLWRSLWSFDGAINTMVMYLIFTWTSKQYTVLCFHCDTAMEKCCVWATKKSIIRKAEREMARHL